MGFLNMSVWLEQMASADCIARAILLKSMKARDEEYVPIRGSVVSAERQCMKVLILLPLNSR